MNGGDDLMRTAGEIIHYLNENDANIYELNKQVGLGDTTLRSRLMKLGYKPNQDGEWMYTGDADKEPVGEDVVSKGRMQGARGTSRITKETNIINESTIHEALMKLDLTNKSVRSTITIQPEYMAQMKELASKTRLRLSDLYTLAIYEFLNKYHKRN